MLLFSASSAGFKCLFDEIMVVDPQLFEARVDQEETAMVKISHRVHSLLELLGVREMYPAEVIRHHILPCFHSQQWKVYCEHYTYVVCVAVVTCVCLAL